MSTEFNIVHSNIKLDFHIGNEIALSETFYFVNFSTNCFFPIYLKEISIAYLISTIVYYELIEKNK